jgi:uncharacterized protein YggE
VANRRQIGLVAAVVVAVVLVLLLGFALGRLGGDDDNGGGGAGGITATGTGKVKAVPDVAEVTLGVSATAPSARVARRTADAKLARVLATLKARGVRAADIQTSEISLNPNFSRNGSSVVGYTATNTVTATLRNLDTAGATVAATAGSGANVTNGLTLTVSDESAVYQRALKAAVADARAHADAIAEASGVTVGDLQSATEGSENGPMPFQAEAKAADAATPIEPGTLEVTATVTATFAAG